MSRRQRNGAEGRAIAAIDRALTSIQSNKGAMRRVGQWIAAKFGELLVAEPTTTKWFLWTDAGGFIAVYEGPDYGCVDYWEVRRDDREPAVMYFTDRDQALRHAGGEEERHGVELKVRAVSSRRAFAEFMEQQRDRIAAEEVANQ